MSESERRARELRAEARAQQYDVEVSVAEFEAASRSLADVLIDFGRRGETVRVETVLDPIVGVIRHVGSDLVGLELGTGAALHVVVGQIVGIRPVEVQGGRTPSPVTTGHPHSLVALLREQVQTARSIEVARIAGPNVAGTVDGVSASHVELGEVGRGRTR